MNPNLLIGDRIFVNKMLYGYSRFSLPTHLIPIKNRILGIRKPIRGEVVVFVPPFDLNIFYIKRIIGLPGDVVQIKGSRVFINNVSMRYKKIKDHDFMDDGNETNATVATYRETNEDDSMYDVNVADSSSEANNTSKFTVPQGHYFVMGDNRDNSLDSRLGLGTVPYENLIGRAEIIFFSSPKPLYNVISALKAVRWSHMFTSLVPKRAANVSIESSVKS